MVRFGGHVANTRVCLLAAAPLIIPQCIPPRSPAPLPLSSSGTLTPHPTGGGGCVAGHSWRLQKQAMASSLERWYAHGADRPNALVHGDGVMPRQQRRPTRAHAAQPRAFARAPAVAGGEARADVGSTTGGGPRVMTRAGGWPCESVPARAWATPRLPSRGGPRRAAPPTVPPSPRRKNVCAGKTHNRPRPTGKTATTAHELGICQKRYHTYMREP